MVTATGISSQATACGYEFIDRILEMENAMRRIGFLLPVVLMVVLVSGAQAQNWNIVIQDNATGTPANQVNGYVGGTATLYATIYNFTGTPSSDDGTGTGTVAPPSTLNFAGFGFTQNLGQDDLASLFTEDSRIPGFPVVFGSTDGSTPGTSGYVILGTFDLSTLAPGTYTEDFTAGAFPDDATSTVPFSDITGTLTLQVNNAAVPEPSTITTFSIGALSLLLFAVRRRLKSTARSV